MRLILLFVFLLILVSCGRKESGFVPRTFKKVEIEALLQDSLLNVRAIEVDMNYALSFAASNGIIGGNYFQNEEVIGIRDTIRNDSVFMNFRSLASPSNNYGFLLSIGSPAQLYKVSIDSIYLVYKEEHEKAFYDSMDFWNDQEGIAIGDPTEDCMSIIITRDGGNTWSKLSCDNLPKTKAGEAAFAASDTNIAIVGDHTWVATGGNVSRVLYSPDKGNTWEVYDTPIIQGTETTGMYSIDFYDALNGFAIGGDYTKPEDNSSNKIRTKDGGKTWEVVGVNQEPGYRSCVQYIPNREGKELVVVGFNGIDYSNDAGSTWKHLSNEGFYSIRFLNDSVAYAAGKGRISKLTFKE
ncbi:MAG: oxidoreductase [Flavobacteriaceae bacterium]